MNSSHTAYERNMPKGLLAGFIATVVLSVLMLMKTMMGLMPQLDVIAMLSGMLGSGPAIGWLLHFFIGTVLYGIAIALLASRATRSATMSAVLLGVIGWLIMMILLMPMTGQGLFGMNLGLMAPIMTLVLHLIFGAALGAVYGKLAAAHAARSPARPAEHH
ncbi:DUF6789 family protein [Stutzerimonas stutzeri]|uniref:DUF6789 family protein n=1 Tax=Stutzerimonas stutzeri TaxID=316 RepID=UPI00210ACE9C|nr:DUF6789 family protein [Stutzerimonas stutzeri]MCQ4322211.1 hypothetical protein [Stutzerimonas stutzeri]